MATTALTMNSAPESVKPAKRMLTFAEGAEYLGYSKSYLYRLTCGKKIKHFKPTGKNIYFDKADLDEYMRRNPIATAEETSAAADMIIRQRGGVI